MSAIRTIGTIAFDHIPCEIIEASVQALPPIEEGNPETGGLVCRPQGSLIHIKYLTLDGHQERSVLITLPARHPTDSE